MGNEEILKKIGTTGKLLQSQNTFRNSGTDRGLEEFNSHRAYWRNKNAASNLLNECV